MASNSFCRVSFVSWLLLLAGAAFAQSPELKVHLGAAGSDPNVFRTTTDTSTLTDSTSGAISSLFVSADFGQLTANADADVPTNLAQNLSASVTGYAKWTDTFNFTPVDSDLIGTQATARFTLSLTGTFDYDMASGASPATASYYVDSPVGMIAEGYFSGSSGPSGEQDISTYALFSFDYNFTIGTPFDVTMMLSSGTAIAGIGNGPSFAHVDLTLTNIGLEVLDGDEATITGAFSTPSGHDYSMAPIPEPSVSELVFGLGALGVVWGGRWQRGRRRAG